MFRRSSARPAADLRESLGGLIPEAELEWIERLGTPVGLSAGRRVIEEGAVGRECMLITAGKLRVERDDVLLGELEAGDFVGEMALLNGQPRSATVTVVDDAVAYAFTRREFTSLLATCPVLARRVRGGAAARAALSAA